MHPDFRCLVNRGVAEGEGWTGGSPAPSAFSDDSQAAMLEGASEIDHLIQQAYFTSVILETGLKEGPGEVSGSGGHGAHCSPPRPGPHSVDTSYNL